MGATFERSTLIVKMTLHLAPLLQWPKVICLAWRIAVWSGQGCARLSCISISKVGAAAGSGWVRDERCHWHIAICLGYTPLHGHSWAFTADVWNRQE
jgi:hypothetical protein